MPNFPIDWLSPGKPIGIQPQDLAPPVTFDPYGGQQQEPEYIEDTPSAADPFGYSRSASDALINMISQFPQRNQADRLHQILGMMAGFGAGAHPAGITGGQGIGFVSGSPEEIRNAREWTEDPGYFRQLEDWNARVKPLEYAANQERYWNTNVTGARRAANAEVRTGYYGQDVASRANARIADSESRRISANASALRAAVQKAKLENPLGVSRMLKDGTLVQVVGGQAKPILLPNGQVAKAMDEGTRQTLIRDRQLGLQSERYRQERDLTSFRTDEGIRRDTARQSARNETDTQRRQRIRTNMNILVGERPELQPYFDLDKGIFTEKISELSPADRQSIMEQVYDVYPTTNPATGTIQRGDIPLGGPPAKPKTPQPQGQLQRQQNTPPPIESRKVGDRFNFSSGFIGEWDGTRWMNVGRWKE